MEVTSRISNCETADGSSCKIVNGVNVWASGINLLDPIRREVTCRVTYTHHVTIYIYSLLLFIINNKHIFNANNEIHEYVTRTHDDLHVPAVKTAKFDNGTYITGIKVYNHLPQSIKTLANDVKSFKSTLKRFLCQHSFYSMNEYYQYSEDKDV
jgi:hypothetical protein